MTTIDAAAATQATTRFCVLFCAFVAGVSLAGCGTSSNLLANNANTPPPAIAALPPAAPVAAGPTVTIAPVIGAPDAVAKQLASAVASAAGRQKVTVVEGASPATYTIRGYIVAARERTGVKVSYIWDVTNGSGQRVNRITGEETISGASGRDPWAAVSPQIVQSISDKTASSLAAWVASQPASAPNAAVAAGAPGPGTVPVAAGAGTQPGAQVASAAPYRGATSTGSLPTTAIVPTVVGAPGDGSTSLSRALQQELQRSGVQLTNQATTATYRVEGKVAMGAPRSGKQAIQIDWVVKDPKGAKLGTVSQKNEIPSGSLDGSWGPTADQAAAAAAQGILKLLPNGAGRT